MQAALCGEEAEPACSWQQQQQQPCRGRSSAPLRPSTSSVCPLCLGLSSPASQCSGRRPAGGRCYTLASSQSLARLHAPEPGQASLYFVTDRESLQSSDSLTIPSGRLHRPHLVKVSSGQRYECGRRHFALTPIKTSSLLNRDWLGS